EGLSVPPQDREAQKERQAAAEETRQAKEALDRGDQTRAGQRMADARNALNRLAEKLPTLEQRRDQARAELGRLMKKQDDITRQAEQAAHEAEKKNPTDPAVRRELAKQLAETARQQAEVAERLGRMDAPSQEARQQRTENAAQRALQDLMDARPQDL